MIAKSGARSPRAVTRAVVAALVLTAAAVAARAQEPLPAFGTADIFDLQYASDARISPDGTRIVYVRQYADRRTDRSYSNLWIVGFDGTGHQPLTSGSHRDHSPRWSPDGTRIAFVSDRSGQGQLHIVWVATGREAQVTRHGAAPGNPEWSPDGRTLAFTALVPGERPGLARLPSPPPGADWADPARVLDRLVHRFDGVGELPPGFAHIFTVPADGGPARQVSSGDFHHGYIGPWSGQPVWSPDGRSILISANRRPDFEMEPRDTDVWEFPLDGGPARQLTRRHGPDNGVVVSPDNRHIAYVGYDDRYQGHQVTQLYVADRDGSNPRSLTAALDRDARSPRWAPDGRGVYFLYDDQGNGKVAHVDLLGRVRVLADNAGDGGTAYGGGSLSVGAGGRFAYTFSTPAIPADVAAGSDGRGDVRPVTALNAELLSRRRLGQVEEVWYRSSVDGRDLHGWIIKPPGFDPSRRWPLILEIHGGPFANYGDRFDVEKQAMASAGYAVLYTNPRGSTSYGEAFGNLIHHAYPGDDHYDLEDGVTHMLGTGYIDPEGLYITGGSGGGVLTAWAIGKTDRYRAAVVVYPVINWYSFALTSDIPATVTKYWFPGPPWEHADRYLARSPISLVGNVTTPTMLLTGEADYRTPMSETEQYYQALKIRGIESVLVKVPDEAHGIRARPSHWIQKIEYIIGWFERDRRATM
jgi:dipeptidyl aminopeptidase/acylaminoacyl peptidase